MPRPRITDAQRKKRALIARLKARIVGMGARHNEPGHCRLAKAVIEQALADWVNGGTDRRGAGVFLKYGETLEFWLDAAGIDYEFLHDELRRNGVAICNLAQMGKEAA